ncbi:glycine betaine/L-proline transport ATP binding subunit, partial [Vibrio parahaemolyticus V-223/04]
RLRHRFSRLLTLSPQGKSLLGQRSIRR